jgi:pyruvate kinase
MRRTKIVATVGPASDDLKTLRQMIGAGVNVVRLNFSHGTAEEKKTLVGLIRKTAKEEKKIVGIMADLQGPKIRIAKFKKGKITLKDNATFVLDASFHPENGDEKAVGIDYKELPKDVKPKDVLLLNDGLIELIVEKVVGKKIFCRVKIGGELSDHKGINRQGGGLSAGALTNKDREDIKTATALGVDFIAVSFVRSKHDIDETRSLVIKEKSDAGIIAKIERTEAIVPETLQQIVKASDGIMVARGDLAIEIGDAEVPAAQKMMIDYARCLNKPVITATQMMESMIHNVVPTRAEVSDVANAVLDGTDAVMLSAETATGQHPAVVIQTMDRVCLAAEKQPRSFGMVNCQQLTCCTRVDEAVAMAAMNITNRLKISAIISLTETGNVPLWASRMRSGVPVYGLSRSSQALGKMALYSDVYPIDFDVTKFKNNSSLKEGAIKKLEELKKIKKGDLVVVMCGDHIGITGRTNSLTVLQVA